MLKFLSVIPWRRVIGIVGGAIGAYETMPDAVKHDPQVWGALAISTVIGAATNAERIFAAKKKAAEGK